MRKPALFTGVAALLGGATLASPRPADAASFDADGTLVVDPSAAAFLDFEEDLFPTPDAPSITVEDAGALEGTRVLALGPYQGVDVPVELPETATRYRVSAWIRGGETNADVEVRYDDNGHAGVDEVAVLYPTGRMTSDGWVELANDHVRLDLERGASVSVGFFSPGGSFVDAVEIAPVAEIALDERAGEACEGSADPICGPEHACVFSQCRYVGGLVPDLPAQRDELTDYLEARMELLFGPLLNRALDLPNARLAVERMRHAEDPWTYWNAFSLAVRRLHDGHTTTSNITDFVLENEKPLGICFIEGTADLSHDVAPPDPFYLDVLVSHVSETRQLGLKMGDRLVARYAHAITVVRCDASTTTCGEPETIVLSDLPAIQPDEPFQNIQCDNRPKRHLADSPSDHFPASWDKVYFGLALESDDTEKIYGAEWESLYSTNGNDYAAGQLKTAITQFKADARGVIFDHRSGNGGTILGPKPIWDFAVPRRPVSFYLDRQHAEAELPDLATGLAMFQLGIDDGAVDYAGSTEPTAMPVALLLTRDVSASDWLPLGLKGAADNVKIFAPYQTNGGFSTRYGFGYWLGMSYVIAVGDTYDATGLTRNGRGVEPDIVVLPKQSDLVHQKDTVFEAALAWIRQELAQ